MKDYKTKKRSEEDKQKMIKRLKTIEGQVRGITNMIEMDRYCGDILIQMSAIEKSLKSVGNEILREHLSTCVVEEVQKGKVTIMDEVMDLIKTLD